MTGVESKIEGLIEVLREDDGRILEICRSGKMTKVFAMLFSIFLFERVMS
jgi:acetolactate synthase small subunit